MNLRDATALSWDSKEEGNYMRTSIQRAVIVGCGALVLLSTQANAQGFNNRETIIQSVRDDVRRKIEERNERAPAPSYTYGHQWHHPERAERAHWPLADEYDAAQERGEILTNGERSFSSPEKVKGTDVIPPKDIHEARIIRDAEKVDPGIVRRTLDEKLEQGEEPIKAALRALRGSDFCAQRRQSGRSGATHTKPATFGPIQVTVG
jgi:hypothetical protein